MVGGFMAEKSRNSTILRRLPESHPNVFEESFDIIVIPGENKFDQITRPSKENPYLDPLAHFPKILRQALKAQALMDLPVFRKYVN